MAVPARHVVSVSPANDVGGGICARLFSLPSNQQSDACPTPPPSRRGRRALSHLHQPEGGDNSFWPQLFPLTGVVSASGGWSRTGEGEGGHWLPALGLPWGLPPGGSWLSLLGAVPGAERCALPGQCRNCLPATYLAFSNCLQGRLETSCRWKQESHRPQLKIKTRFSS